MLLGLTPAIILIAEGILLVDASGSATEAGFAFSLLVLAVSPFALYAWSLHLLNFRTWNPPWARYIAAVIVAFIVYVVNFIISISGCMTMGY